ncbi:MAG: CoA transferase [Dehalococcoidia bacterium]|nr:CoA transferase [Dehalococcoidia bacterium]
MQHVLEGIKVLDLSQHVSGPYCSLLLADMGAEVIRIDPPGGSQDSEFGPMAPSGYSYNYIGKARNKKGISLDISVPQGRDIFYQLVSRSDIVLENFPVDIKKKRGLEYEKLVEVNAAIILVSISGFGLTGPDANRTCFDTIAQAFTGVMSITGYPDGPPTRCGVAWIDYSTALHAAVGALGAVRYRDKTGKGQLVDVSLVDTAFNLMVMRQAVTDYRLYGIEQTRTGNRLSYVYANSFLAKDGWVFISIIRDGIWRKAARAIGREDLQSDTRFASISGRGTPENQDKLDEIFSSWVAEKTTSEVIRVLSEAGVPCARINSVAEAIAEPQIASRGIVAEIDQPGVGKVAVCGTVVKMSESPGRIERPAPVLGEHNEEIYCGLLGYTSERLADLKAARII